MAYKEGSMGIAILVGFLVFLGLNALFGMVLYGWFLGGGYGAAIGVVIPGIGSLLACITGICLIDGGILVLAILIPIISGVLAGVIARGSASRGFVGGFVACMIGYFINFLIMFLMVWSLLASMAAANPYGAGYGAVDYGGMAPYVASSVTPLAQIGPMGGFMTDTVISLILMLLIMPIIVGILGGIGGAIMSAVLASSAPAGQASSTTTNIIQAPAPATAPVVIQGGATATGAAPAAAAPAAQIKCPACGTGNDSGTTFCQSCGTRLKS